MHGRISTPASVKSSVGRRLTGNYVPEKYDDFMETHWNYVLGLVLRGGIHPDRAGDVVADIWEYILKLAAGTAIGTDGKPKKWDILAEYDPEALFDRRDGNGKQTAKFRSLLTKIVNVRVMNARDQQAAALKASYLSMDAMPWTGEEDTENPELVRIMARHGQVYDEQLYRLRRSEFYRIIGKRLAEVMPETADDPLDLPLLFDMLMLQDEEARRTNQKELADLAGLPVGQIKKRMNALRELLAQDREVLYDLIRDEPSMIAA